MIDGATFQMNGDSRGPGAEWELRLIRRFIPAGYYTANFDGSIKGILCVLPELAIQEKMDLRYICQLIAAVMCGKSNWKLVKKRVVQAHVIRFVWKLHANYTVTIWMIYILVKTLPLGFCNQDGYKPDFIGKLHWGRVTHSRERRVGDQGQWPWINW